MRPVCAHAVYIRAGNTQRKARPRIDGDKQGRRTLGNRENLQRLTASPVDRALLPILNFLSRSFPIRFDFFLSLSFLFLRSGTSRERCFSVPACAASGPSSFGSLFLGSLFLRFLTLTSTTSCREGFGDFVLIIFFPSSYLFSPFSFLLVLGGRIRQNKNDRLIKLEFSANDDFLTSVHGHWSRFILNGIS